MKSRSDKQLLHGLKYNDTSSCNPEGENNGLLIVPCGLIAWSLFNDTYAFYRGAYAIKVNRKNIAWRSDREHKYGKDVYPSNFQSGSLIGGATLDPNIPVRPLNRCSNSDYSFLLNGTYESAYKIVKLWHINLGAILHFRVDICS